jgi:Mg-chelatase subunit ChlI
LTRAAYVHYPFAAIVAQEEAKLAVLLAAVNPRIGGVLLSGNKGIGKTSIVRGLIDLLPLQKRARCAYGCDPDGSSLCEECAAAEAGTLKSYKARAEVVELPANAQIDDVVGTIDVRAALEAGQVAFRPGLLARANRSILYVDEINLLSDVVVDTLLDAAAGGVVRVKRGQQTIDYPSRFTLVGTMNPEEGELRPQIADRLGLRVFVGPAKSPDERAEIYRRNAAFARDPAAFSNEFSAKTKALRTKIARAIALLPSVEVQPDAEKLAIEAVMRLGIESHRTEFVALEAACALAAYEGRTSVTAEDVRRVFAMAARLRRSRLRVQAVAEYAMEDSLIDQALEEPEGDGDASDAQPPEGDRSALIVSPEFSQRDRSRARVDAKREGQPVETRELKNGRIDVPATVLSQGIAARSPLPAQAKESVEAAVPPHLTVFVVDASQSTAASARAVHAAMTELLRPIYSGRELAALISCWGPHAEVIVDENVGRNIELIAERLGELEPDETRSLTPLPDALEQARKIATRFRRANPSGEVEVAVFSDGRANVPLGAGTDLASYFEGGGDARTLADAAAEQCRTLAARLAGRTNATFINLDTYESSSLMRELAEISRGRYFSLNDIVARLN